MRISKERILPVGLIRKRQLFLPSRFLFVAHGNQDFFVSLVQGAIVPSQHENNETQCTQSSCDADLPRDIARCLTILKAQSAENISQGERDKSKCIHSDFLCVPCDVSIYRQLRIRVIRESEKLTRHSKQARA